MNVVTADATVARNLMLVVERCHLNVEAMAASPYVAGLSVLTDDEADLGAAVVGCLAAGSPVTLKDGPRTADGHDWWQLDSGGWAAADYLQVAPDTSG